mgnify:CR=1 FL=1
MKPLKIIDYIFFIINICVVVFAIACVFCKPDSGLDDLDFIQLRNIYVVLGIASALSIAVRLVSKRVWGWLFFVAIYALLFSPAPQFLQ